jgi:hypothetical protein
MGVFQKENEKILLNQREEREEKKKKGLSEIYRINSTNSFL